MCPLVVALDGFKVTSEKGGFARIGGEESASVLLKSSDRRPRLEQRSPSGRIWLACRRFSLYLGLPRSGTDNKGMTWVNWLL